MPPHKDNRDNDEIRRKLDKFKTSSKGKNLLTVNKTGGHWEDHMKFDFRGVSNCQYYKSTLCSKSICQTMVMVAAKPKDYMCFLLLMI